VLAAALAVVAAGCSPPLEVPAPVATKKPIAAEKKSEPPAVIKADAPAGAAPAPVPAAAPRAGVDAVVKPADPPAQPPAARVDLGPEMAAIRMDAEQSRVVLTSLTEDSNTREQRLLIRLTGSSTSISRFLMALETRHPLIRVDEVSLLALRADADDLRATVGIRLADPKFTDSLQPVACLSDLTLLFPLGPNTIWLISLSKTRNEPAWQADGECANAAEAEALHKRMSEDKVHFKNPQLQLSQSGPDKKTLHFNLSFVYQASE
jgi:hypothetical protein